MPTGPLYPVEGPIPVPYPNNLIAVATIVTEPSAQAMDPETPESERWEAGLRVWETPCDDAAWVSVDPCGRTALAHQRSGGIGSAPSFGEAAGLTCTAAGIYSQTEFEARARDVFNAYEAPRVEAALETHPLGASDYQLSGLALISGTWDVAHAIAELEGQRRTLGVLHLTPRLATLARAAQVIAPDNRGRLFTANGTPVVTGAGYGAAHDATKEQAYITGPVVLRRSPLTITPPRLSEAAARDTNDVTFYAQRVYAIAYDRCDAHRIVVTR